MPDQMTPERLRRWIVRDFITLGWDWLDGFDAIYADFGMNYADEMVLATLILDREGRCRPRDLDLPIRMAPSTLTKSMRRLENLGFVTRETDSSDRRALWLVATPEGKRVLTAILPLLDEAVAALFSDLSPADEARLRRILDRLRDR